MFAADSHFEVGSAFASTLDTEFYELAHAFLVENLEGIVFEDIFSM